MRRYCLHKSPVAFNPSKIDFIYEQSWMIVINSPEFIWVYPFKCFFLSNQVLLNTSTLSSAWPAYNFYWLHAFCCSFAGGRMLYAEIPMGGIWRWPAADARDGHEFWHSAGRREAAQEGNSPRLSHRPYEGKCCSFATYCVRKDVIIQISK